MRTLSARILLGFTALTVTFGIITTNIVINQRRLETYVGLVNRGLLPLSQLSKDLARRSDDLKTYLAESFDKEPNADSARIKLDNLRQRRNKELAALQKFLVELDDVEELDSKRGLRNTVEGQGDGCQERHEQVR